MSEPILKKADYTLKIRAIKRGDDSGSIPTRVDYYLEIDPPVLGNNRQNKWSARFSQFSDANDVRYLLERLLILIHMDMMMQDEDRSDQI